MSKDISNKKMERGALVYEPIQPRDITQLETARTIGELIVSFMRRGQTTDGDLPVII